MKVRFTPKIWIWWIFPGDLCPKPEGFTWWGFDPRRKMEDRGNTTILNRLVSCVCVFIRVQIGMLIDEMLSWSSQDAQLKSGWIFPYPTLRKWFKTCQIPLISSYIPVLGMGLWRQPQCGHPALGRSAGSRYHETSEWGALDVCPDVDPWGGGWLKILGFHSDHWDDRFYIDIFDMSGCLLFGLNTSSYPISVVM